MSAVRAPRLSRVPQRWFWRSPLALAALITGIVGPTVVERARAGLGEARRIHGDMERLAARVVADGAAIDYVSSDGATVTKRVDAGGGIIVETRVVPDRESGRLHLTARVGEQCLEFRFPRLAGGASPVFASALSVAAGVRLPAQWRAGAEVVVEQLPQVLAVELPAASGSLAVADAGIALMRLAAGTDRDDFVLATDPARTGPQPVTDHGAVTVAGNLWLDRADAPLLLELAEDLTLVVRGNVYLGRELRVTGAGHLTIVAVGTPGSAFADCDGNGRWSAGDDLRGGERFAGPMEGAGNVYLGLPREGQGRLDFDVGLVVTGVLHVAVDTAYVHGPVVLHHGGLPVPGRAGMLVATGRRLPSLRVALPGFVAVGAARPGPLQALVGEPLYQAGPAR